MSTRTKFATQVDAELLAKVREMAKAQGKQIQALMDEALADLLEKHDQSKPRRHVMTAYRASHGKYAGLYKKLAE